MTKKKLGDKQLCPHRKNCGLTGTDLRGESGIGSIPVGSKAMKKECSTFVAWSWLAIACTLHAQGTFQNLNFEAATVSDLPSGHFEELVATAAGIPGWRAWSGTNDFGVMWHNVDILGYSSALPAILGPNQDPNEILQGRYTVLLHSGVNSTLDQIVPSSISQVGTVPVGATALRLRVSAYNSAPYSVTFDQVPLSLAPVFIGPNYTLVDANISPFSGQTGELRFTAFPTVNNDFNSILLDDIAFVPEPGTVAMIALGALLLGWRLRRFSPKE